ncbi:MAG TPA: SDR family oxidoreductase [Terriglobales bacterium]
MRALVIGGTRNLGPSIVQALLKHGYEVSVFNRGQTADDLPSQVLRLRGDRGVPAQLAAALGEKSFDLVVDTTLYTGREALAALAQFSDRVGRYIFLSTGQVYLVRTGVNRPFREEHYHGSLMARPPESQVDDIRNWLYGIEKREVEDAMALSWKNSRFPFTSLRLPMVNSERDHYDRIYGYFLRLNDGGPILVPAEPGLPLRHVYGADVVEGIVRLAGGDLGTGEAYNIGQDEAVTLEEFLRMLARFAGRPLELVHVPRATLSRAELLPDCSPFSGLWMSALDNSRSKRELGMEYTRLEVYLQKLVSFFESGPRREIPGYRRRQEELEMARNLDLCH